MIERLLLVEDNPNLQRTLTGLLEEHAKEVRATATVQEACAHLEEWRPDFLVVDMSLPDGTGLDVLRFAQALSSAPLAIAISGTATPEESFALGQLGVRVYLQKPLDLGRVEDALRRAQEEPPDLRPHLRAAVGRVPVREMEEQVRETMVDEALGRADGSKRGAARLLSVSRQLLQQIIRKRD